MQHNRRKSQLQERRAAADLGGKPQPGSGSSAFYKGDVRSVGKVLVECKTTSKKSYTLSLSDIEKIKAEALMSGEESWAFQIEFQGMSSNKRFAVIDWQEYLDFRKAQEDANRYGDRLEGLGIGGPKDD